MVEFKEATAVRVSWALLRIRVLTANKKTKTVVSKNF